MKKLRPPVPPRPIGQVIRELRLLRGKTQIEMAEILFCTQPTYSQWEAADDMRLSTLRSIAKALNVSPKDLL